MSESSGQKATDGAPRPTAMQRMALKLPSAPRGAWDTKIKFFETKFRLYVLIILVVGITLAVGYWAVIQDIQRAEVKPLAAGVELAVVLAPVLAAAAGVERFLETIFGLIEGNWKTLVAYLGRGLRWLQNAEVEVENARAWLNKVASEYNRQLADLPQSLSEASAGQPNPAASPQEMFYQQAKAKLDEAQKIMNLAEARLSSAEAELSQVTNSNGYKNAKRAASIYLGLLLGVVVAAASSLQMFALMGIRVSEPRIDVVITGLVIGSGSAPVHSLINILQSAKNTLDSAQDWLGSKKGK